MEQATVFLLDRPDYSVKQLLLKDAAVLQELYEQCHDFALLTDGIPFSANAAGEEFDTVPKGKTTEDIYIFGLFDSANTIIGEIVSVRQYPDEKTWWIGTMMLAKTYRSKALGTDFYRAFERWLLAQGIQQISLCAIEANELGLRFWQKMGFKITRQIPSKQFGIKTHKLYVLNRTITSSS